MRDASGARKRQPDELLRVVLGTATRRHQMRQEELAQERRSKYFAKGEFVDGKWFPSQAEAMRYRDLCQLLAKGAIDALVLQPSFDLRVNNVLVGRYKADFRYHVIDDRGSVLRTVIEDVKGMPTETYKLKRKLAEALHGIKVIELPSDEVRKGSWSGRTP